MFREGIPVLSASVLVPEPEPEKTARRIKRYYQLQCRSFLRYCERWLLPQAEAEYRQALESSAPLPSFRAELTYQITYNEGGLWSLYTQSRPWPSAGHTAGRYLGPGSRVSGAAIQFFLRRDGMEKEAAIFSCGRNPTPGTSWGRTLP